MRRVLHLRMVTQCAMLEEFGIFLVLADKVRQLFTINLHMTARHHFSLFLPIILKPLSQPRPMCKRAIPLRLRNSMGIKMYNSSVLAASMGVHSSFI